MLDDEDEDEDDDENCDDEDKLSGVESSSLVSGKSEGSFDCHGPSTSSMTLGSVEPELCTLKREGEKMKKVIRLTSERQVFERELYVLS